MLSVALIGLDGAGKTTIGRELERSLPLPVKYVYMGINHASSNVLLPTSRLALALKRGFGRRNPEVASSPEIIASSKNTVSRLAAWLRSYLSLANLLAEESFRHSLVWYYQRRGKVVLLDRWFFADYYTSERSHYPQQPVSRRIHDYMLRRVYPQPDLVIYLEAPAEVLFARKREGTLETLKRRQKLYSQLRGLVKHFAVVDATQPPYSVAQEVTSLIDHFYKARIFNGRDPLTLPEYGGYES